MFKHGDLHATNQIKPKTMKNGRKAYLDKGKRGRKKDRRRGRESTGKWVNGERQRPGRSGNGS